MSKKGNEYRILLTDQEDEEMREILWDLSDAADARIHFADFARAVLRVAKRKRILSRLRGKLRRAKLPRPANQDYEARLAFELKLARLVKDAIHGE